MGLFSSQILVDDGLNLQNLIHYFRDAFSIEESERAWNDILLCTVVQEMVCASGWGSRKSRETCTRPRA